MYVVVRDDNKVVYQNDSIKLALRYCTLMKAAGSDRIFTVKQLTGGK